MRRMGLKMIEAGTFRRGVSYSETVDGRIYAIRILPVRRLDQAGLDRHATAAARPELYGSRA